MPATLIESQFAALEEPRVVDVTATPDAIVAGLADRAAKEGGA
jgi:hypothetical protein